MQRTLTPVRRTLKLNRGKVKAGDIFSEESHYIRLAPNRYIHLESGDEVSIAEEYMEHYFDSADQFTNEVDVTKEDRYWTSAQILKEGSKAREGDLRAKGIRSIWNDIHSGQVFTVNFSKQSTEMSEAKYEKARDNQLETAIQAIVDASDNKKGVKAAALRAIQAIQDNPIERITKGEERTLRGYKTQFTSINGAYNVIDMDLKSGENQRQLNVNNINWLIFNGTKYNVI